MNDLDALVSAARELFAQAATPADLENAKAQFLGKSGRVTELMKGMAALSVEEKKTRGAAVNVAKQAIEAALNERRAALAEAELQRQLQAEALDVTLPGRVRGSGGLDGMLHAVRIAHIAFDGQATDVFGHAFGVLHVQIEHSDFRAQTGQFAGRGLAQTGATAGDQCCLSLDVHVSTFQMPSGFSIKSAMPWPPPTQALEMP